MKNVFQKTYFKNVFKAGFIDLFLWLFCFQKSIVLYGNMNGCKSCLMVAYSNLKNGCINKFRFLTNALKFYQARGPGS